MMVDRWTSENGDPDNFMNVLIGGQRGANLARWCDSGRNAAIFDTCHIDEHETRTRRNRDTQPDSALLFNGFRAPEPLSAGRPEHGARHPDEPAQVHPIRGRKVC
ncbi:MAG: hypothetical protein ACAH20_16670 [Methylobacteriaceae bacterium]